MTGEPVKVSRAVGVIVKRTAEREGEKPGPVLEALVRHGLAYRSAIRSGGRLTTVKGANGSQ